MVRFSVIIPTFNEEQTVHRCIRHVRALEPAAEIVVADGSSENDTVRIAQEERVSVCVSDRNRGSQCNAGACLATGDILLFLHADTKLPTDAFAQLSGFFEEKQVNIGTFRLAFDAQHWLLALYPKLCRFDSKFTRCGDQCIVVRKSFFDFLGGFPEWPLFEDVRLLQVARKTTRVYSFPGTVTTSARRFLDNGILKQYALDVRLIVQYLCGGTPLTAGNAI